MYGLGMPRSSSASARSSRRTSTGTSVYQRAARTLQSMIRGESVVLIAEQSRTGSAGSSPAPKPKGLPSFHEELMTGLGMSYEAATAYIERYNDMVDHVNAVAARYANDAASSLAGTAGDLTETATPLGDVQPFEYTPDTVSGDVEALAGSEGTPGNNQAQNRQFRSVVKALELDKDQAQQLHQEISGENMGYREIMQRAQDMFGGGE